MHGCYGAAAGPSGLTANRVDLPAGEHIQSVLVHSASTGPVARLELHTNLRTIIHGSSRPLELPSEYTAWPLLDPAKPAGCALTAKRLIAVAGRSDQYLNTLSFVWAWLAPSRLVMCNPAINYPNPNGAWIPGSDATGLIIAVTVPSSCTIKRLTCISVTVLLWHPRAGEVSMYLRPPAQLWPSGSRLALVDHQGGTAQYGYDYDYLGDHQYGYEYDFDTGAITLRYDFGVYTFSDDSTKPVSAPDGKSVLAGTYKPASALGSVIPAPDGPEIPMAGTTWNLQIADSQNNPVYGYIKGWGMTLWGSAASNALAKAPQPALSPQAAGPSTAAAETPIAKPVAPASSAQAAQPSPQPTPIAPASSAQAAQPSSQPTPIAPASSAQAAQPSPQPTPVAPASSAQAAQPAPQPTPVAPASSAQDAQPAPQPTTVAPASSAQAAQPAPQPTPVAPASSAQAAQPAP
ncbi:hypothetical protein HYH03_006003 [Edaphochlamys debaryana]|uniref:Uncharacterized protein n=1 Tax=Edaphochlamys debaryana TaxID=47281 RepID=A0A835YDU1_9CHLO|nr:hypothetical protein HYH03_006003 [Edaphochlamys debaryana]|eukprot:KAG2495754.1 hypothetical protein HYH03_006003 [Edaphochlamys debaryana]